MAAAKHIHLYAGVRISAEFLKDGRPETEVFGEQRLKPVDVEEVVEPQATSGDSGMILASPPFLVDDTGMSGNLLRKTVFRSTTAD
ncbi:hypothetical protein [Deinococcus hopiensis]|uniref:hypothetical protein n=1 Tax=Deinococcus hopiensis TaxID=309885 RepID=UPI00111C360E|nr:hypothetical protein [Deinococcus hopiensis]